MPSHEFDKAHFDRSANDERLWRMRGDDLHLSSSVLREKLASSTPEVFDVENDLEGAMEALKHSGLISQAAMLQGFAVEVLLKAYWLNQGGDLSEDGKYRLPPLSRDNHNLVAIADAVQFPLSDIEQEVLGRLSLFVSSYGRYPITKKWTDNPMREDANGIPTRLSWNDADHGVAEAVIERLKATRSTPSSSSNISYLIDPIDENTFKLLSLSDIPEDLIVTGRKWIDVSGPGWNFASKEAMTEDDLKAKVAEWKEQGYTVEFRDT